MKALAVSGIKQERGDALKWNLPGLTQSGQFGQRPTVPFLARKFSWPGQ
jgi:hypothetical protein